MDRGKWKGRGRGVLDPSFFRLASSMLLFLNRSKSIPNVMWTAKGKKDSSKWKVERKGERRH